MLNNILTNNAIILETNSTKYVLNFLANSTIEPIESMVFCPNDFAIIIIGKITLGDRIVINNALGYSFKKLRSKLSPLLSKGFVTFSAALLISLLLLVPGVNIKLLKVSNTLFTSTGNLTLSQSSNSTTPDFILDTIISIYLKSTSLNSKNASSTTSVSDIFAIPETSISFVLSKHIPKILFIINNNLVKSISFSFPSFFSIDIAPVN